MISLLWLITKWVKLVSSYRRHHPPQPAQLLHPPWPRHWTWTQLCDLYDRVPGHTIIRIVMHYSAFGQSPYNWEATFPDIQATNPQIQATYSAEAIATIMETGAKSVTLKEEVRFNICLPGHHHLGLIYNGDSVDEGDAELWGLCELEHEGQSVCRQHRLRWMVQVAMMCIVQHVKSW